MIRAKEKIKSLGGVEHCNVFTKYQLALFGQFPWEGAPAMPIEVFVFPKFFYFNLYNISYWSRTVLIPLLVLLHFKPNCPLSENEQLDELFLDPKAKKTFRMKMTFPMFSFNNLFLLFDKGIRLFEKWPWKPWRKNILKKIEQWIFDHTDKGGGLGAIYPAMMNSILAMRLLGHSFESPWVKQQWEEIKKLIVEEQDCLFVQPCHSPVWDTALSILALSDSGLPPEHPALGRAAQWLVERQSPCRGDWAIKYPKVQGKGWFFQFQNDYYPDIDDTTIVLLALERVRLSPQEEIGKQMAIQSGTQWILGMQSLDGGWGAFDKDNNKIRLNTIPFADHGALLDPSTADLTARAIQVLNTLHPTEASFQIEKGISKLLQLQEKEGPWFGRWGVNYIYGSWSVLVALKQCGFHPSQKNVQQAVHWFKTCQNSDGGWGESPLSYEDKSQMGKGKSTPSQTSWALMGLLSAGEEVENQILNQGVQYLIRTQLEDGGWEEKEFTGTGFPKVFYLRYRGYGLYFPLMALSQISKSLQNKLHKKNRVIVESSL